MKAIWDLISAATQDALRRWQRRHYHGGLAIEDEPADRGVKADLAISLEDCEEIMKMPAHDHRLRGDE